MQVCLHNDGSCFICLSLSFTAKSTLLRSCRASQLTYHTQAFPGQEPHTPQPLYNIIVGVHSINRVSETTMLYPNKNISIILMVIFQYSLYILGSIFESCYPKPCYNELCYKEVEVYFLPSLRQQKGKNDNRNDFMSNLHQSYVAELGFKLTTTGPAVRCYQLHY